MTDYAPDQEALVTVPTLSPIPLYQDTVITEVFARHVRVLDGRTFRRRNGEQVGFTDADKMAGNFVARLIPTWHPDYAAAAAQHEANILRSNAWEAMKHWQRHPFDPAAAHLAAHHLAALGDYQATRTEGGPRP